MYQTFIDTAAGWSMTAVLIRLVVSMLVGALIGLDREMKRKRAGVKTHIQVCMGSALVMITSEYVFRNFPGADADLLRMGAQVISGVGFLGVGTIIITGRQQVKGLTTAAGLWTCACVGLAAGIGFIEGTVFSVILIIFSQKFFSRLEALLMNHRSVFDYYIEFSSKQSVGNFIDEIHKKDVKIIHFELVKTKIAGEGPSATMTLEIQNRHLRSSVLNEIRESETIRYIEEL